jgi:hypothetical protein
VIFRRVIGSLAEIRFMHLDGVAIGQKPWGVLYALIENLSD